MALYGFFNPTQPNPSRVKTCPIQTTCVGVLGLCFMPGKNEFHQQFKPPFLIIYYNSHDMPKLYSKVPNSLKPML
jgi:hypothetical protein